MAFRVSRVPVAPEPLLGGARYDYADAFEVRLDRPDTHPAEVWLRTGLEESPAAVRRLILLVHRHVARFDLGPADADHVLGWHIAQSSQDVCHLQAGGPLLRAHIVARRTSPTTSTLTTFLLYERRQMRLLWLVVGPLHRAIAPFLLRRAAAALTASASAR